MTTTNRILIIEDEPDVADMLCFFLNEHGYEVYHAGFGLEGISAARLRKPNLILLDSILPDIDGYSICRELRQMPITAHIPIIFLTRRSDRANRLAALELGADDFIAKPFDLAELLLRIRNTIQRAQPAALREHANGFASSVLTREQMDQAQQDPTRTIIEIRLAHRDAFVACYGPQRMESARASLREVVLWATAQDTDSFAGMLNATHLVVIRSAHGAREFADRISSTFAFQARNFYDPRDLAQGYLMVDQKQHPLLAAVCHLHDQQMTARTG